MAFPIVEKVQQSGLRQGKLSFGTHLEIEQNKVESSSGLASQHDFGERREVIVIWESFGDPFSVKFLFKHF